MEQLEVDVIKGNSEILETMFVQTELELLDGSKKATNWRLIAQKGKNLRHIPFSTIRPTSFVEILIGIN